MFWRLGGEPPENDRTTRYIEKTCLIVRFILMIIRKYRHFWLINPALARVYSSMENERRMDVKGVDKP